MSTSLVLKITGPDGRSRDITPDNPDNVIIGSGPEAAVRVDDPKVSKIHCLLKIDRDGCTVMDLGSEGGTRLAGAAISGSTALASGDNLHIGGSRVKVIFGEGVATDRVEVPVGAAKDIERAGQNGASQTKQAAKDKKAAAESRAPEKKGGKKGKNGSVGPSTEARTEPLLGTAGSVARLFNEELPAEEQPTKDTRELEVALLWGDTIINVGHFGINDQVTIGSAPRNDFHVFASSVGESFALAATSGDGCMVSVPAGASVRLRRSGVDKDREKLSAEGALTSGGGADGQKLKLELLDRAQITIDRTAFLVRWVRPHKLLPVGAGSMDFYFTKILTTTAMAGIILLAAIFMTDINAESLSEDLFKNPQRFAKLVIKPPEKEKKKLKDLSGIKEGAKAQKDEGKFGKKEAKKDDADPSKKGAPRVDANKREEDRKKVMAAGLLGALGGAEGSASNVFGPGGLGTGINSALGGLKGGAGMGDAHGVGGLGSRGTGPGGGGTGLGLGGLGTKGSGRGAGGYGTIDLGGRGKGETRVVPGKTTVTGSCERTVIAKVIGRHANEVRYCYETELNKDPNLQGKVGVTFTIDPTGGISDASVNQTTLNNNNVEQCILTRVKRWKFPEPKGGGVCVINYPWVFKAAGSGADDE
jgi:TonB family protein